MFFALKAQKEGSQMVRPSKTGATSGTVEQNIRALKVALKFIVVQ